MPYGYVMLRSMPASAIHARWEERDCAGITYNSGYSWLPQGIPELTGKVLDRQPLYVTAEDAAVGSMLTALTAWGLNPKAANRQPSV